MPRLNVHRLQAVLVGLWLLGAVCAGGARAQTTTGTNAPAPAELRLAEVVPRLPKVNLFAIALNERGEATPIQPADLKALVGSDYLPVASDSDEGIGFVFLIDVSGSMRNQLDGIKNAIQWWIDSMSPVDQAAVVTLGSSVKTVQDFTKDKSLLKDKVAPLTAKDANTLLYQGMVQAMDLARRLDANLPLRRAIVMLTDGMDDQQGGAGRQQVTDAMAIDPIPIYAIGASDKSSRVDAALKDFAALVYASGGGYRRVEVIKGRTAPTMLSQSYSELRNLVAQTHHFTAECKPCNPDGSPVAVKLRLTQGAVEVNSGTVTVLSMGTKGKAEPRPPPPPPSPPATQIADPNPPPGNHGIVDGTPPPWWIRIINAITGLGWQWLALAGLGLAAVIAGLIVILTRKPPQDYATTRIIPEPGPTLPVSNPDSVFGFSRDVRIPPGTEQHKQRLRLTPLGHNDLPAEEAIFDGDLSVGRSPDNKVCIYNDSQVSAKRCTLSPKDGLILVRDEESRNGTRVNGVPITGFIHAEPDSILGVGRTELRMQLLSPGQQ